MLLVSLFPMKCSSISWHDLMKKYWLPFHNKIRINKMHWIQYLWKLLILYFLLWSQLQVISFWTGLYELALTDKYIQARFGLKMIQECWDREFFVITTIFKEVTLTFKKYFWNIKIKLNSRTWMTEVLSSDFSGFRTSAASLTSLASATSVASTASKVLFHPKTSW